MSLFAPMMNTPVLLERRTGIDHNGKPAYAQAERILARIAWEQHEAIGPDGQRVLSEATLYTATPLATGDRVTAGLYPRRVVLAVYERKGLFGGADHWEARL